MTPAGLVYAGGSCDDETDIPLALTPTGTWMTLVR